MSAGPGRSGYCNEHRLHREPCTLCAAPATPTPSAESLQKARGLAFDCEGIITSSGNPYDYERELAECARVIALALDAAKEQTRRDTAEQCAKVAEDTPGSLNLCAYDIRKNIVANIRRAFPLVPAPAEEDLKAREGALVERERLHRGLVARAAACWTCDGTPPVSGKPCICGGTSRHSEEVANMRLGFLAAEQRVREYETAEREDEDAACRLEELRAKFGIAGGTAEEIVGAVGLCLDMLMENQDRQEQRVRVLEEALRWASRRMQNGGVDCHRECGILGKRLCPIHEALTALAPAQEEGKPE